MSEVKITRTPIFGDPLSISTEAQIRRDLEVMEKEEREWAQVQIEQAAATQKKPDWLRGAKGKKIDLT